MTSMTLDELVERIVARGGDALQIAAPLGLGKPNHLLNAIYRRFKGDPSKRLTIFTALSLDPPTPKSDLERRFMEPFVARQFGANYPRLEYVTDLQANQLPKNVKIQEFYFASGALMHSPRAQRDYASINYSHVARDLAAHGEIHAVVQLVAKRETENGIRYSLSCNPDVTLDLLHRIEKLGKPKPMVVGVVHPDLPFLGGDADVGPDLFDAVIESGEPKQRLFAVPREPIELAEHALGLHASTLVKDGGTLQIGIGALSDALVSALLARHEKNDDYRAALTALRGDDPDADSLIRDEGGLAPFSKGLYGASEMVMDGFMHLRRAGILKRLVVDDLETERALLAGEDVAAGKMRAGHYLKGAFFLGSNELYAWLRGLQGDDYAGLFMNRVSDVNQLYGGREALDAMQRRDGRFFNTCMMATALGAAVSDALEDGRVVSGVGGQYNFVAMAHAIEGGRSALFLRATRPTNGGIESNIRWSYGHTTIPRHLRDLFVTEYGVADLRGKSDQACILAMLAITDARFQDELLREAVQNEKVDHAFCIPEAWRKNTPEALKASLQPLTKRGLFPRFPFGSDFTDVEQRLLRALAWLEKNTSQRRRWPRLAGAVLMIGAGRAYEPELERLELLKPRDLKERVLARLVRGALEQTEM